MKYFIILLSLLASTGCVSSKSQGEGASTPARVRDAYGAEGVYRNRSVTAGAKLTLADFFHLSRDIKTIPDSIRIRALAADHLIVEALLFDEVLASNEYYIGPQRGLQLQQSRFYTMRQKGSESHSMVLHSSYRYSSDWGFFIARNADLVLFAQNKKTGYVGVGIIPIPAHSSSESNYRYERVK